MAIVKNFYQYFASSPLTGRSLPRFKGSNSAHQQVRTPESVDNPTSGFLYTWGRSRELERRNGNHEIDGIHSTTGMRVLRRFGMLPKVVTLDSPDPKTWPLDIDAHSKLCRLHHYSRVKGVLDARRHFEATSRAGSGLGVPIQVDACVTRDWHKPHRGVIPTNANDQIEVLGTHNFAVMGYRSRRFVFVNSWGQEWGDSGFGYLSDEAYGQYVLDAWVSTGIGTEPRIQNLTGIQKLYWKSNPSGRTLNSVYGREIVNADTGERIAWAFATSDGPYLDLEEFIVWPSARHQGYGSALAAMVKELSAEVRKPIRAWVPYGDAEPNVRQHLYAAMRLLGLTLHNCPDKSAACVGLSGPSTFSESDFFIPARATSTQAALSSDVVRVAVDDSIAKVGDTIPEQRVYRVWYATNRLRYDVSAEVFVYTTSRGKAIDYGTVDVFIPKSHITGSTGPKWYERWQPWRDDELKIIDKRRLSPEDYWNMLKTDADANPGDSLLFIHGYNVDFSEAAIRAAQVGFDLRIQGRTGFFSWPSKGEMPRYKADEASIEASEESIRAFIRDFSNACKPGKLHIIAHSMGNRGLLRAMKSLVSEVAGNGTVVSIGQVIMAAPDVDADVFKNNSAAFSAISERATLYVSPRDIAVSVSEWLHNYQRAGISPPVTTAAGIDTIVVPKFNLLDLGHGYFAEAAPVIEDIYSLVTVGAEPSKRMRLSPGSADGLPFWEMSH